MTNFSTNQVMQFYVADANDLKVNKIPGRGLSLVIGGKRTDIIENVLWGKLTTANALKTPLKTTTISFVGNKVVGGENYVVRVSYPEVFGIGPESWTTKTALCQAVIKDDETGATYSSEEVLAKLKDSLKEILPEYIVVGDNTSMITLTPAADTEGYDRELRPVVIPEIAVSVNKVMVDGDEVDWAKIDVAVAPENKAINGSYKLADMEYFALGERGDEYRRMGWPNVVHKTKYNIVPSDDANYDVLVVHYAFAGSNDQSHLSEKDLVVAGSATDVAAVAKAIVDATGVVFTKVSGFGAEKTTTEITPAE